MTGYKVSELVSEVKVILDRNQETSTLVPEDADTLTQAELIERVLLPATRAIEQYAPAEMLGDLVRSSTMSVTWTYISGAYAGTCILPENLLRIISVRASDWDKPGTIILDTDKAYAWQRNVYVRGNTESPIVALTRKAGKRVLELYSSKTNKATVEFVYLEDPSINNTVNGTCINASWLLHDAIVYMAASLVCSSIGDTQTAASLKAIAYQLANIETTQTTE